MTDTNPTKTRTAVSSYRLDPNTLHLLSRIAAKLSLSRTAVLKLAVRAFAAASLLVLLACVPHTDRSVTAGFVCEEIADAFCSHWDACYPDIPFDDCRGGYRYICCERGQSCNVIATRTSSWVDDCTAALWGVTCEWFVDATAVYPAECRGY